MTNPTLTKLGTRLFELKERKETLEDELRIVNIELGDLATVKLAQLMSDSEIDDFTISGLGKISLSQEVYASVLAENREALHAWLRENGCGDLVKEQVPPQSLKAFVKERLNEGKPLPPMVKATFIPTAKPRKSKPGASK